MHNAAPNGRALDSAIEIVLSTLICIFRLLQLEINWAKGKTECLLLYRGKRATRYLQRRRVDGKLWVQVEAYPEVRVHVVTSYQHLGTVTSLPRVGTSDAKHRSDTALTSYVPIANKVFSSQLIGLHLELLFMHSLVLSRLFFNVHVLVPSTRYIRILNGTYMRVVRRIAGCSRFHADVESDLIVRNALGVVAVDCLIQQARLRYLRRILVNKPIALQAVLSATHSNRRLPWVDLIIGDMRKLRKFSGKAAGLPDPVDFSGEWLKCITADEDAWHDIVSGLRYRRSLCDKDQLERQDISSAVDCFGCDICSSAGGGKSFPSLKALKSHQRAYHGIRIPTRYYVEADGRCICCGTVFMSRLRCIAHLSDSRRGKCWQTILSTRPPRLSDERVEFRTRPTVMPVVRLTERAALIRLLLDQLCERMVNVWGMYSCRAHMLDTSVSEAAPAWLIK